MLFASQVALWRTQWRRWLSTSSLVLQRHESLSFTKSELSSFAVPDAIPEGPGISGEMGLADSHCGIQSASGVFNVWTKPNPDVDGEFLELFEGFVSFDVSYSGLYRRKRHGNGDNIEFAFWVLEPGRTMVERTLVCVP